MEFLKLDDDLNTADPPLLIAEVLAVRGEDKLESEIGKMMDHLYKFKHIDRVGRYMTL